MTYQELHQQLRASKCACCGERMLCYVLVIWKKHVKVCLPCLDMGVAWGRLQKGAGDAEGNQ